MRRIKFTVKYVLPFIVVIQLLGIFIQLKRDKAFNCKMYAKTSVACRQIKI
tara:strand:+ start:119 stop:271 length:153 start_codon:yes stop_codon:yes gene_type:complete